MDEYEKYENEHELICALGADLPGGTKPNLFTMNDFAVIKNKKNNTYTIDVETMLGFETKAGAKKYAEVCLDCFTKYMKDNELNTEKELNLYEVFTEGLNINTEFFSLEQAYATLKLLVRGFDGNGMMF